MSKDAYRRLFAEGAIGLSLVAGAYFFIVDPLQRSVSEARQRRDAQFISRSDSTPAQARAELSKARERIEQVSHASAMSSDELAVMGNLNRAADEHGVQVQNIEKRLLPVLPAIEATMEPKPVAFPKETRFGFSISATGTYPEIVGFLDSIQRDIGFADIESLRVVPSGDSADPRVTLTVATTHWWFDTNPARTALDAGAQAFAALEDKP